MRTPRDECSCNTVASLCRYRKGRRTVQACSSTLSRSVTEQGARRASSRFPAHRLRASRQSCENSSPRTGSTWDAVELDAGEPIPPLEDYDALWVMGGPMDVWDVEEHPWLVAGEAGHPALGARARPAVPRALPRAPASGRRARRHLRAAAAAGDRHARRRADGGGRRRSDLFRHAAGAEMPAMALRPRGAAAGGCGRARPVGRLLACRRCGSAGTPGRCSTTSRSSRRRSTIGARCRPIGMRWNRRLGADALGRLKAEADAEMAGCERNARQLYRNFMQAVR